MKLASVEALWETQDPAPFTVYADINTKTQTNSSDIEIQNVLSFLVYNEPKGEIKGIKARGNYEINLVWNNGKVSKASITSKNAGNLTVKYNGKQKALNFKAGETKLIK